MERKRIKEKFKNRGLRKASIEGYASGLVKFLKISNLSMKELDTLPIEKIEDKTKDAILRNVGVLAPKYLNLILNAIKTYLYFTDRIRSRKAFAEIRFDKSSTLENGLLAEMLETEDVRRLFTLGNGKKKIVLGLCGLSGLRPSIVPYLRVKHIHKKFYKLDNGKITIEKPALLIIPNLETDAYGKPLRDEFGSTTQIEGNKAGIPFPCFIPSFITEILERELNKHTVTPETSLTGYKNRRQINHLVKSCYEEIGYKGRCYDLRNYASTILDRLVLKFNNKDLKEFLMGHKPKIASGLYTLRGLNGTKLEKWTREYVEACESYLNEAVFGVASANGHAEAYAELATELGVNKSVLSKLEYGKLGWEQYRERVRALIVKTQETRIRGLFDTWMRERESTK